ncbi:MAG: hypothetical protein K2P54_08670 [Odoribacter sp.]|nr:hypothetical protein [Odoribacter sp.]
MKNIVTKITACCFLFLLATLAGCDEDQKGTVFNSEGKDAVSFLTNSVSYELAPEMNGVVKITLSRTDKDVAGTTVNISLDPSSDPEFTLANSVVTFEAGKGEACAELHYELNELQFGTEYAVQLNIENKNLSPAAEESCVVTMKRKLTWKNIGQGTWTTQLFDGTYPVEFEEAEEAPGALFRVLDMITDGFPIEIMVDKTNGVAAVNMQNTGFKDEGDILYYNAEGTYVDGVITFPRASAAYPNNYYFVIINGKFTPAYYLTERFVLPQGY